jgi:EAL domain-containing protein (putative c-di-GMP-specific phosphodiesterase class I)
VQEIDIDRNGEAIVRAIIALAKTMGLSVVAEGVETLAHGSHLLAMGCHLAQGYGIARPMPADQLMAWRIQWLAAGAWRRDLQPVDGFPR